jgi:hypothetical protein
VVSQLELAAAGANRQAAAAVDQRQLHFYMAALAGFTADVRGVLDFFSAGKSRSRAYSIFYLLRCFVLSQTLASAHSLRTALFNSVRLLVPGAAVADVLETAIGSDSSAIPSPATISRLRGRIDVAWMMSWRHRIQDWLDSPQGLLVYLGTDSSPQGGRDYQIAVMDFIKRCDLPALHSKAVMLQHWRSQPFHFP